MLSYVKSISYGQRYVCKLLILRRRFVLSDTLLAYVGREGIAITRPSHPTVCAG